MIRAARQLSIALLVLSTAPLFATTIVPFSDEALVDKAPVILVGHIVGRLPGTTDRAVTDWLVGVERVLKGSTPQGAITVRVLGGETPAGDLLKIEGAPEFRDDEEVLLFLNDNRGRDPYEIFQFNQGAFHKLSQGEVTFAVQDFSEVHVVSLRPDDARRAIQVRDFGGFVRWIEARLDGGDTKVDYLVEPPAARTPGLVEMATIFSPARRWFDFDSGGSVAWKNNGSQIGIVGGGGNEFGAAMSVWVNEETTPVRWSYVGTSTASSGFTSRDGQNVILFGDPNHEIQDVDCASGGVLALGGSFASGTGTFNGRSFLRISEADMVVNNGIECLFSFVTNPSRYIERLFAHELGHTLGITHPSENPNEPNALFRNALMYFLIDFGDTRGAQLNSDDVLALQSLYKKSGSAPPPRPTAGCPAGTPPNTLCLLNGRFRVTGTWRNQFDGSTGVTVPIRNTDVSGFFYYNDPSNVELIMKILDFGSEIKVFYSQLTNLQFTLTVTDSLTGRSKNYSNTPGNCGAIDHNFAAASSAATVGLGGEAVLLPLAGSCVASSSRLCLGDRRFAVTVDWRNQYNGATGIGAAKSLSSLTGAFSFDDAANLEILIKTLDFGNRILVLYGSLSNFEYTIQIVDTVTGRSEDYRNAAGNYCGGLDENAF